MNPLPILVLTAAWLFSRRKNQSPQKPSPSTSTSERTLPGTNNTRTVSDRGFDVFINFRGPDSRHTVANVLYNSLTHAGFRVFLDDEEIRKGEVIEGELLGAITNSSIYIPIFSKDYASSRWCLRELAKMIDCWESSSGDRKKVILPIFYDVVVSKDVKLRSQVYTVALQKHKDDLGEVTVQPWEDALRKVARIKGWNLKDHGLSDLADLISKEIFNKLTASEAVPSVLDRLVGIDKPIGDIMKLLEEGSSRGRYIVIHGMGGIGKTTLADAIFKKISSQFQGRCFLRDIRQAVSVDNIMKLQEKLLLDALNLNFIKVSDTDDGIGMISRRLRNLNVLIVLDDVDKRDHLLKLAAKSYWFGPKSKIIITARNIEFLPKDDEEYYFYAMKKMDSRDALKLFCRHAFEKDEPPPAYHDISIEIVATTGRLPLALQVIGSSLFNQEKATWKFRLDKLKEAPHKDVQETLLISYQALDYEQQQIFLDIACLFNGEKMIDPIYFWEACKYYPYSGIKILLRRSMIKVYHDDILWMHDQLRDLGRVISQAKMPRLHSQWPGKPSRLCSPEVALDVVHKQEIDESVIALNLGALDADFCFLREQFARAANLKFLQLQGGNFAGDFKDVLQQLMWLSWFDCPQKFEVDNLCLKNLVILKLSGSEITEDCGGWSVFTEAKSLKAMHLRNCNCLKKTPDFSSFLGLERLILNDCLELEEIDKSINKLKNLKFLEISNNTMDIYGQYSPEIASRLQLLPNSIGSLESLIELKIENAGLTELHPAIGELVNLNLLSLRCPQLEILPDSIGKLLLLVVLDLSYSIIKKLPDSIGDLKQLNILRMDESAIEYLPDTIGKLESLEELNLPYTNIALLPETIGNLNRLKVINVSYSKIKMLPKALVKLQNLERLEALFCFQMDGKLPEEIGRLSHLSILNLFGSNVSRVPTTMSQLSHLQELNLDGIHEPQDLLKLPTSLVKLIVKSSSLESHRVPDLSSMTNLVSLALHGEISNDSYLTLSPCIQTPQMNWLVRFTKLEVLTLDLPDLISPPTELSSLSCLRSVEITCFDPQSLAYLPLSLEGLRLKHVKSPIDWQILSNLNNLSFLGLDECWLKEIKVDCLEQLRWLYLYSCEFLERISNLSSLKKLQKLETWFCPQLVDIEGLGELKSMRSLILFGCASIQRLPNLSKLKKLEELRFNRIPNLESIPDVNEEAPCCLELFNCKHFHDFDGPYSEHHCAIIT